MGGDRRAEGGRNALRVGVETASVEGENATR